jgi:hypothetical protein
MMKISAASFLEICGNTRRVDPVTPVAEIQAALSAPRKPANQQEIIAALRASAEDAMRAAAVRVSINQALALRTNVPV